MKYIYGLSKSGESIVNYLNSINENFFCWDDNIRIRNKIKKMNKKNHLIEPEKLNYKLISESFISPGISLNNKKINILKSYKVKLYRDLELYSRIAYKKKIIAVTGTNGKSTTTKLISNILNKNNISNFMGGNIGIPLLDFPKKNNDLKYHVIELSSYQLESFNKFNPFISILLNVSRDHLDRYKNFKEYIYQKEKLIFSNLKGYNIICIDDKNTLSIYKKYKKRAIPISSKPFKGTVFYKNKSIIDDYFEKNKKIELKEISSSLFGNFNIQNILAAYAVSKILNINVNKFTNVIKKFKGLPHRLEVVIINKKYRVINNSKSTNLESLINSIKNYKNINLIVGGKPKDKKFKKLLKYKNRIKKIYLIGESSNFISKELENEISVELCNTLQNAIKKIFLDIKKEKQFTNILFSPGCASFDQFKNFEERGNEFKRLVKKINHE